MTHHPRDNLLGMSREALTAWFVARGEKPFRAVQVLKWVHQRGVTDFDAMTDLSKAARAMLQEQACIDVPEIALEQQAKDGTRKWLLRLDDGNCIETVFIPEDGRGTLCVSSQVGCALDCSFCSTARQGFNRNLSSAEIIGQLHVARQVLQPEDGKSRVVSNVVMMGMGEPLLNFEPVVDAMSLMLEDNAYGLSRRRVTLSTSGIVPAIDELRERLPVSLALSLHAPDDALRNELVPINRKYPLKVLLDACRRYAGAGGHHDRITMEYVMLDGVNDSSEQARALAKILADIPCKVNLIPFNPFPGAPYQRSSQERINTFRHILTRAGLITVTRRPRGDDIDAACGQLVGRVTDRTRRAMRYARIESVGVVADP